MTTTQTTMHPPAPAHDESGEAVAFSWQAWPARDRPLAALATLTLSGLFGAVVWLQFHSLAWGCFAGVGLVISLHRFFLPSTFTADAQYLTATYPLGTQRLAWKRVRRFVRGSRGAFLAVGQTPSRLDPWTGMPLYFPAHAGDLVEKIQQRLQSEGADRCVG